VRGAKWSLAPTGGPLNAALPSRTENSLWGKEHHAHVRAHLGHSPSWCVLGEDLPDESDRVEIDDCLTDSSGIPAPEVTYRVCENSRRLLDFNVERAQQSFVEAGAHRTAVESLTRFSDWHLLGTARMGDDPATSVVDGWGRAHDVPHLHIADGSVFVTSGAVKPTSTIVPLALRNIEHLIENRREQRTSR
jgi:choline dehydrogenase-like flavoprotein